MNKQTMHKTAGKEWIINRTMAIFLMIQTVVIMIMETFKFSEGKGLESDDLSHYLSEIQS